MTQIFEVSPNKSAEKQVQLIESGWTIISVNDASTPYTTPDARGVSYGGPLVKIVAQKNRPNSFFGITGGPMNPS